MLLSNDAGNLRLHGAFHGNRYRSESREFWDRLLRMAIILNFPFNTFANEHTSVRFAPRAIFLRVEAALFGTPYPNKIEPLNRDAILCAWDVEDSL